MSDRIKKINKLIRKEVSRIIEEINTTGLFLTVKAVEADRDLRHARIWISVMGKEREKEAMAFFKEHSLLIERQVRSQMFSKYTPKLDFLIDHSEEYLNRIERLLSE